LDEIDETALTWEQGFLVVIGEVGKFSIVPAVVPLARRG